jgi:hypothetical protein
VHPAGEPVDGAEVDELVSDPRLAIEQDRGRLPDPDGGERTARFAVEGSEPVAGDWDAEPGGSHGSLGGRNAADGPIEALVLGDEPGREDGGEERCARTETGGDKRRSPGPPGEAPAREGEHEEDPTGRRHVWKEACQRELARTIASRRGRG